MQQEFCSVAKFSQIAEFHRLRNSQPAKISQVAMYAVLTAL